MLPCIGRAFALDDLVDGYVRLAAVHSSQGEAALLQLGLRVVPVLVKILKKLNLTDTKKIFSSHLIQYELLQPRKETYICKNLTVS